LAVPNGAGKTTAASALLPGHVALQSYLNADEMARNVSPADVEAGALAAGRVMIERMRAHVRASEDFAIETTCAGKSYLRFLAQCKLDGWRITLLYFWLSSPELAIERVARRVSMGGHNIPTDVIMRRYYAGLSNMRNLYLPLADEAEIHDNTERQRVLIAEKREGLPLFVHDPERWRKIEEAIR